jgi:uncharacterized protein YjiS (DUF1127 family)
MRDYALHVATTSDELPGQGLLIRLWRNWFARRAVVRLQDLDDHLLQDIGVTRDEITEAAHVPLTINAIGRLNDLSKDTERLHRPYRFVPPRPTLPSVSAIRPS